MDDERKNPWEATQERAGAPAGPTQDHPGPEAPTASRFPASSQPHAAPQPPAQAPAQEEKTWALLAHLSALAGLIIPFGNILGPLVVWLAKKDQSPFVDHQGKEALNFQITMGLAILIAGAAAFVGVILAFVLIGIPILFLAFAAMAVFYIAAIVFAIIGGIKANEGVWYRYPMTWRFIQ